jgi:hypothetical protein
MGHHSQYRKRGTTPSGEGLLSPPPTPLFTFVDPNVIQTAQGGNDVGGWYWIEASLTEGGAIVDTLSSPWQPVLTTPKSVWSLPIWLRTWEAGNGSSYLGPSLKSAWLHITS